MWGFKHTGALTIYAININWYAAASQTYQPVTEHSPVNIQCDCLLLNRHITAQQGTFWSASFQLSSTLRLGSTSEMILFADDNISSCLKIMNFSDPTTTPTLIISFKECLPQHLCCGVYIYYKNRSPCFVRIHSWNNGASFHGLWVTR